MVVEGDREVQQQEKLEDQEGEMVDNDEVEQRRKESQPLIVRDTVVEVLLDIDFKFFSLKTVSKLKLSGGNWEGLGEVDPHGRIGHCWHLLRLVSIIVIHNCD